MTTFQAIILIIFIAFIVLGVLLFSGVLPGTGSSIEGGVSGDVLVWGTVPEQEMRDIASEINSQYDDAIAVSYEEKTEDTYEREIVESLAAGAGPDLFFLPARWVVRHGDKVRLISTNIVSRRSFRDTYIEAGEIFDTPGGYLAVPISVDPMVMYWNRDLFSAAGIAQPPRFWDEFLTRAPQLTKRDPAGNILQSGVALGEFRNITHAKDLVSALILQTRDTITSRDESGRYAVSLDDGAASALRFYTEFSNQAKTFYAWNRSLPESLELFATEELAVYFGRASDIKRIRAKNPHLNFDVALLPQIRDSNKRVTYGALTGLAVAGQSDNSNAAAFVALVLANEPHASRIAEAQMRVPARRDTLARPSGEDPYRAVFYESAVAAENWFDPDPEATREVFRGMIENIASGRLRITGSVSAAKRQIERLFSR